MRTCTKTLKIDAVTQQIRTMLGLPKGGRVANGTVVEVMIGISTNEKWRAGGFPAKPWQSVRYPLLEADMSFGDCLRWLEDRQDFIGEDFYFCGKVRAHGMQIFCDHDASNMLGHIGDKAYRFLEKPKLEAVA